MKKIKLPLGVSLIVLSIPVIFIACKKPAAKPTDPQTLDRPELPAISYDYANKHGVENNLATLGRVLFYDRNLSGNKMISCGSCHKQEFAFADNVRFNKGSNGVALKRNSPSIQGIKGFFTNPAFQNAMQPSTPVQKGVVPNANNQQQVLLFWDGRQNSMPDMVLNPVLNHNEMNMPDFGTLVQRLNALSYYPNLFQSAYGDASITKERIAYALEGFLSCLNTTQADNAAMNGNSPEEFNNDLPFNTNTIQPGSFLTLEDQGRFLFHSKYNCAQCHDPSNSGSYGSVSSPSQMFNIGLDEVYADNGLGAITGKPGDQGMFKVPTLKNISVTAPYMHDGRFTDLSQVLDHYSHGIKDNPNLSSKFIDLDGTPKKLNIFPDEKKALIAFLNSLRDDDFLTSPMYSDPFLKK